LSARRSQVQTASVSATAMGRFIISTGFTDPNLVA